MLRLCAIVVLSSSIASCALAHERRGSSPPPLAETGIAPNDASISIDAAAPRPDTGPIASCFDFWNSLPSCPASPMLAIGQPCSNEGVTCGVHCCEPGPPIGCEGGRWAPVSMMDDCRGVRCQGPQPCGAGQCASGRVCVVPAGELGGRAPERCAIPPAPIDRCSAAPPGSLADDGSCTACTCGDAVPGVVLITLDCRCC